MTPASKGRWLAFVTVSIVTIAWTIADTDFAAGVLAAGIYVGVPYGLFAGTLIGRLAGRLRRRRGLVIVAALVSLAPGDAFANLVIGPLARNADPLLVLSIIPTLVAATVLELWTRPAELVPRAAVRA